MICPSCNESLTQNVKHCNHCGIAITKRSVQAAKIINNLGWIARRSLGGFFAGGIGFIISIAVARTLSLEGASTVVFTDILELFPGNTVISTAIAGCFIGTVGGMIERSAYKSFLGGVLGMIGGLAGGFAHPLFEKLFQGQLLSYSFAMAGTWGLASAFVGLTSGILEGTKKKILAGILGGLVGGVLGGGIGSQMYGAMLIEIQNPEQFSWLMGRLLEAAAGGIVAVNVWFFIGFSEKLYIFKRRQLVDATKKVCDSCNNENALNAWYCANCGSALQVAASREQMHVTPYRGLERISNAFQYLSWLSATAGVVTSLVVFLSFLIQNFFFALFGSLLVALIVYMVSIFFKAIADTIKMSVQISERLARDNPPRQG